MSWKGKTVGTAGLAISVAGLHRSAYNRPMQIKRGFFIPCISILREQV